MKKPIFALIPSGYKASKLYTPIPINGEADFVSTRGTVAHRMNKDGYLEEMAANVPRLDYWNGTGLSECPTLLAEDTGINLMPYSEDFTQGWINLNITDTANSAVAPNGELTATKLERTITGPSYTSQLFNKSATAIQYTSSIFVKQGNTPYFAVRSQGSYPARVDLRFDFATKSFYYANAITFTDLTYNVEEYPNGWFRLQWTYITDTHTSLTGVSMSPKHLDSSTDGNDLDYGYCYVWGAQTEEFNNATSYIKTLATSATRALYVTETLPILGDLIDSKKGTMYAEIASTDDLGTFQGVRLSLDGDRADNSIRFIFFPQSGFGRVRVIYRVAGISTLDWSAESDIKNLQKFSISWSEDILSVVVNGAVVATLVNPDLLSGLNILDFYRGVRIKEWKIWDEVLTDEELIELTTL